MKCCIIFLVIAKALYLVSPLSISKNYPLLNLVSPHFPPYSYEDNHIAKGVGPELIRRVLQNTDIPYKITIVKDYGTAVHVVKVHLADGLFLASQNKERDSIAVFSEPLMINKWSWYMLKDSNVTPNSEAFKLQAGIGSIKDTNTSKWLMSNGYAVKALPVDAHALVAMLKSHRIDAAFVADAVFEHELSTNELLQFKKTVQVEKPFGIYISHDYLSKNPVTLEIINRSIKNINKQ